MFIDAKECGIENLKNVAGVNCSLTLSLRAVDKNGKPVYGEYREPLSETDIEKIKNIIITSINNNSKDIIENLIYNAEIKIQQEC